MLLQKCRFLTLSQIVIMKRIQRSRLFHTSICPSCSVSFCAVLTTKHLKSGQWLSDALPFLCAFVYWVCECEAANINNTTAETSLLILYSCSPADKRCDNDTPGRAAAVGVGLLLAFAPPAAQEDGIEEQEQQVQGQTGQRHTSQ